MFLSDGTPSTKFSRFKCYDVCWCWFVYVCSLGWHRWSPHWFWTSSFKVQGWSTGHPYVASSGGRFTCNWDCYKTGTSKIKSTNDGDSNFDNFVLLQEEFDPKRHFSKLKKATLHFTLHHGFTIRWKIMLAIPLTYLLRYGLRDLISSGRTEDPLVNVRVAWWQSACR